MVSVKRIPLRFLGMIQRVVANVVQYGFLEFQQIGIKLLRLTAALIFRTFARRC